MAKKPANPIGLGYINSALVVSVVPETGGSRPQARKGGRFSESVCDPYGCGAAVRPHGPRSDHRDDIPPNVCCVAVCNEGRRCRY